MNRVFRIGGLTAWVLMGLASAAVWAADHPLKGDSLLMRDRRGARKASFRTTDPALDPRLLPDPRRNGATLEVLGGGDGFGSSGAIFLAPELWTALGTPPGSQGYRYADTKALTGIRQVSIKPSRGGGQLAIKAGGDAWAFALAKPQHNVSVRLAIADDVFCSLFEKQDMARNQVGLLSASHAPAPFSCAPAICGNTFIEPGEQCDSPVQSDRGCCLPSCVLAEHDFCHPEFAESLIPEKARLKRTYKQRMDNLFRQANLRQGSERSFEKFAGYVEQLDERARPDNLFDLAMTLFSMKPDLIPSFRTDVQRLTPMIRANRTAASLSEHLQELLQRVDAKVGGNRDYALNLFEQYDVGEVSYSDIPVVKDPYAVEASCGGFDYCAVNPFQFSNLILPHVPGPENLTYQTTCENTSSCQWPIKYDLVPRRLYLEWSSVLPLNVVEDILNEDGYALSLSINGINLPLRGPQFGYDLDKPQQQWWASSYPCEGNSSNGCLMTVLVAPSLTNILKPSTLPWKIELEVQKLEPIDPPQLLGIDENGNPIWASTTAVPFSKTSLTLNANPTNGSSFFESILFPTFQADRCTDCHGFGTFAKLEQHHGGYDFSDGKYEESAYDPDGHVLTCYNCHDGKNGNPLGSLESSFPGGVFTETDWKAPHLDLDLDWYNMTAPEICARVKQNLPTRALRHQHFHEDARLFWAIEKPRILGKYLTKAYPEDFALFLTWVDAWNDGGAPCP